MRNLQFYKDLMSFWLQTYCLERSFHVINGKRGHILHCNLHVHNMYVMQIWFYDVCSSCPCAKKGKGMRYLIKLEAFVVWELVRACRDAIMGHLIQFICYGSLPCVLMGLVACDTLYWLWSVVMDRAAEQRYFRCNSLFGTICRWWNLFMYTWPLSAPAYYAGR